MKKILLEAVIPASFPIAAVLLVWILSKNKPTLDLLAGWFFLIAFASFFIWYGPKFRLVLGSIDAGLGALLWWTRDRVKCKFTYAGLVALSGGCIVIATILLIGVVCSQ
jgi:hypothetical protein